MAGMKHPESSSSEADRNPKQSPQDEPQFAEIEVEVVRARQLPRGLRRPSGFVRLECDGHTLAESDPVWRDTAPSFAFRATVSVPYVRGGAPALDLVVCDRSAADAELGRTRISFSAHEARGWYPLRAPPNSHPSHADLLVIARWPACPAPSGTVPRDMPSSATDTSELRAVHPRPGRLFRAGDLRVEVVAHGVPVSLVTPFLTVHTGDQILRARETDASRTRWEEHCKKVKAEEVAKQTDAANASPAVEISGKEMPNTGDPPVNSNGSLDPALLSADAEISCGSNASGKSTSGREIIGANASSAVNKVSRLRPSRSAFRTTVSTRTLVQIAKSVSPGSRPTACEISEIPNDQPHAPAPRAKKEHPILATLLAPRERREVDFGTFTFALLQGVFPSHLKLTLTNNNTPLPDSIGSIFDKDVELPTEIHGFGPGPDEKNSHDIQFSLCEKGPADAKLSFSLRIMYAAHNPSSTCNIVTPRFRELMSSINEMTPQFKTLYPMAEGLTYLLVGGLFTNHYPTYFKRNIDFLQEKLCLPRVQSVPINTESSVESNAIAIRDAISKTCSRRKSIVLIGHSKGGVDILEAVSRYPEIVPFVYGIVTFQAPFSGTFAIDYVSRSQLAVKAITGAIETLLQGEKEAFQDMSYSARDKELKLFECEGKEDSNISTDSSGAPKESPIVFREIPIIAVASCAPFDVFNIRSAANAAGVASMAPIAQLITKNTGFRCDGLVVPVDARVPFCDLVYLEDMMHTEPALYVPGTKYPPGEMTASVLALLFEKTEGKQVDGPRVSDPT